MHGFWGVQGMYAPEMIETTAQGYVWKDTVQGPQKWGLYAAGMVKAVYSEVVNWKYNTFAVPLGNYVRTLYLPLFHSVRQNQCFTKIYASWENERRSSSPLRLSSPLSARV